MEPDEELEARFELTAEDLVAWYETEMGSRPTSRAKRRPILGGIVVVAALCVLLPLLLGGPLMEFHSVLIACAVGLLIALPVGWKLGPARRMRQHLRRDESRGAVGALRVGLDPRGVGVDHRLWRTWSSWELVSDIRRVGDFVAISVSRHSTVVVPRRAFADDAQADRLCEMAQRLRAMAPSFESRCPRCGYDLRNVAQEGCPECGWRR